MPQPERIERGPDGEPAGWCRQSGYPHVVTIGVCVSLQLAIVCQADPTTLVNEPHRTGEHPLRNGRLRPFVAEAKQ